MEYVMSCKMKLVKFKNGKYGVRRGVFSYSFADFKGGFWWSGRNYIKYINDCQSTEEGARTYIETYNDKGVVVIDP
jgi:hypothetical protein